MKQYITVEQRNELSNKAWEKLQLYASDLDISPLLSIGQMIEFLDEKSKDQGITIDQDKKTGIWGFAWYGKHKSSYTCFIKHDFQQNNELCDALFSAVKEVLENEK